MTFTIIAFIGGVLVGLAVALVLRIHQAKTARELADEFLRETEIQRKAEMDAVIARADSTFRGTASEELSRAKTDFLQLAETRFETERAASGKELDSKKSLIDQQLQAMTTQLEKVSQTINELEKDRVEKFGQLDSSLKLHHEQAQALIQTTGALRQALASTKVRGQWGERMAEDVLRLAGFVENVNYLKQQAIAGAGSRPDFTFLLPRDLKLNMDVKFPLDNYLRYLEAGGDSDRSRHRADFVKDVRDRVKEIATRDYINPQQNTVDYVLMFIPNEQVYAFIHEQDRTILDEALRKKVIICSPLTLFAVLAVIRQAVDNFALEGTSRQILELYNDFRKQWEKFVDQMDKLGDKIQAAQREYHEMTGTRRRQLDRVLERIEDLRTDTNLPLLDNDAGRPENAGQ